MNSIKLSFKWGVYLLFLLTLIFDRMRRLGKIGSIRTLCKIFVLGTEIKKSAGETFQSTHYQSRKCKKIFLEGISQLSIMVWPTNMLPIVTWKISFEWIWFLIPFCSYCCFCRNYIMIGTIVCNIVSDALGVRLHSP